MFLIFISLYLVDLTCFASMNGLSVTIYFSYLFSVEIEGRGGGVSKLAN